jgi:hypothetical protein
MNEFFIFCTLRSDHFEFLKTLPSVEKVDLSLLFRSKKIFKYPKVLWWNLELLLYTDEKKFNNLLKWRKKVS